jgi:hypothetical protein
VVICGVSDSSSFVMTGRLAYPQRHGWRASRRDQCRSRRDIIGMLSQKFGRRPTITVIGLFNLIPAWRVLRPCRFRHYEQNAKDCIREAKGTDDPQWRKQLLKWVRE